MESVQSALIYFNPHSRGGMAGISFTNQSEWRISIHAPAWGATLVSLLSGAVCTDFNPHSRFRSDQP